MLFFVVVTMSRIVAESDTTRWHIVLTTGTWRIVVWPTTSCFADWSKRRHVTLRIIDCQEGVEYLQHVKS